MRRFETVDIGYELSVSLSPGDDDSIPVVFINALGTAQDQWDQVLPRLYLHTVLTYDRPGIGRSDPLPPHLADQPRTIGALADELRQLLDTLGISSPHVVVGHSLGALIARMYTARHGSHVAGLVLVDPTTRQHLAETGWPDRDGGTDSPGSSLLDISASITELGTAIPPPVPAVVLASAPGRWLRLTPAQAAEYAPRTPEQLDAQWQDGQHRLAASLGPHALLVVADWAGHHIATDQPELVAACITAAVAAAHGARPVSIPAAQLRYAGGSCRTIE
ncbi:alpha/beta fold hydrolase [Nocardia sp. NPDC058499]|uniref:alpha/beta fold hydrolase n=1 Tax=Nocardia sp. NPDC058499 TaxID=3346530 RepID=UPI0036604FDA